MKLITTSWDDGHELDFKLADLLNKYGLQGTFYIPQSNKERKVMTPTQMQVLGRHYEIGGHTLHHTRLNAANAQLLQTEISGSFQWLKNLLGYDPVSFCFPGGLFNTAATKAVFKYGYKLARTTELLSIKTLSSFQLLPTTLQVYEHSGSTYARHLAKRKRWTGLVKWLNAHSKTDLAKLTTYYIDQTSEHGGCFHLWGHSWEIEEYQLWNKLEEIFKILSCRSDFAFIQNKQVLSYRDNKNAA